MVFTPVPQLPLQLSQDLILANAIFEFILLPLSLALAAQHIRAANKITDTGAFHVVHTLFCLTACANETLGSFVLNISYSCNDFIQAIQQFIVQQFFFNFMSAIFFNHWHRAILGRDSFYRMPRYGLYAANVIYQMLTYTVDLQNLGGNDDDTVLDESCEAKAVLVLIRGVMCLAIIMPAECLLLMVLSASKGGRSERSSAASNTTFTSSPFMVELTAPAELVEYPSDMEAGADQRLSGPATDKRESKDCPKVDQAPPAVICNCTLKAMQPCIFGVLFVLSACGLFFLLCASIFKYNARMCFAYYYLWKPLSILPLSLIQLLYMTRFRHLSLNPEQGWIESRESAGVFPGSQNDRGIQLLESETSTKTNQVRESLAILHLAGDAQDNEIANDIDEEEDDGDGDLVDNSAGGGEEEKEISEYLIRTSALRSAFQVHSVYGFEGSILVEECLHPPALQHLVASQFSNKIALPALQHATNIARADLRALLKSCQPPDGSTSRENDASREVRRLYENIVEESQTLLRQYERAIMVFSAVLTHENTPGSNVLAFKASTAKDLSLVSPLPTNLQVHEVSLSNSARCLEKKTISAVTFGAPAAHVMGFKHGGLRSIASKVKAMREKPPTSPEGVLRFLQLKYLLSSRTLIVVSQALGGVVAATALALAECVRQRDAPLLCRWQVDNAGLLLHSVGLLSTIGKEAAMLDDWAGSYDMLELFVRLDDTNTSCRSESLESTWDGPSSASLVNLEQSASATTSHVTVGTCGKVTVTLRLDPPSAHAWALAALATTTNRELKVVPVLMNLGVNEIQTVANAKKMTKVQTEINQRACQELKVYYARCLALEGSGAFSKLSSDIPSLLTQLEQLVEGVATKRTKEVDLLLVGCLAARLLGGARTTSCKSAKDRTSIFFTLEVSDQAARAGLLNDVDTSGGAAPSLIQEEEERAFVVKQRILELANALRGPSGLRLKNCELNVGRAKFAFNSLQLQALPQELRPPEGTFGGGAS